MSGCHIQASGFGAVPAGNCNGSSFNNAGNNANFWSATQNSGNNAYNRNLNYNNAGVNRNNNNKNNGFSVRCLRDKKRREFFDSNKNNNNNYNHNHNYNNES